MKTYEFSEAETELNTETRSVCEFFIFEDYKEPQELPDKHVSIQKLAADWEQDDRRRSALQEARAWVADTFYSDEGDTPRSLRLRKGWSQTRLADEIATSQSHIARIERGTENLAIQTCRRLAKALDVDLNTLDQALQTQERMTRERAQLAND